MRASVDCIPCVFLQALNTSKRITSDEGKLVEIQHELMRLMPSLSLNMTPAELSYYVLKQVYTKFGVDDPFEEEKRKSNELMLALYERMEKIAEYSTDKKHTALKMAAAGNIIDLGIKSDFDVSAMITKVLEESFRVDDFAMMMEDIEKAGEILYLTDNSGEIVGDKLFISSLERGGITVAVKGRPMLNDACMDDAEQIGLGEVAKVISNGSGMLGTVLSDCSEEFVKAYNSADLIISKGQANFESLEGIQKNIYYVMTVKCGLVAEHLGAVINDAVVMKGIPGKKQKSRTSKSEAAKKQ